MLNLKITNGNLRRTVVGLAAIAAGAGGIGALNINSGNGNKVAADAPAATTAATFSPALTIGDAGRQADSIATSDCWNAALSIGQSCTSVTWPVGSYSGVNQANRVQWWERGSFKYDHGIFGSNYTIGLGPYGGVIVNSYSLFTVPRPKRHHVGPA